MFFRFAIAIGSGEKVVEFAHLRRSEQISLDLRICTFRQLKCCLSLRYVLF